MAEYIGTQKQITIQKRMRQRHEWISQTPGAVNGGRIMSFDDPDRVGWDKVGELVRQDKLAVFPMFPKNEIVSKIEQHLGRNWKIPTWLVFLGTIEDVTHASTKTLESYRMPHAWKITAYESPSDDVIGKIQTLNELTGVAPYPAFFSRGEATPIVSSCIVDDEGNLVACASAVMRYHTDSRLGGVVFAGMVSVDVNKKAMGLGKLVNAHVLVESQIRFKWAMAKEQAAADKLASRAMIEACGLQRDSDHVSVAVMNPEDDFT